MTSTGKEVLNIKAERDQLFPPLQGNFLKYRKTHLNKTRATENNCTVKYIVSKKTNYLNDVPVESEDTLEKYGKKAKESYDLIFKNQLKEFKKTKMIKVA